jgi:hypothetical protein
MLIASMRVNTGVHGVPDARGHRDPAHDRRIVTAGVAWYTSAAGVMNGVAGKVMLPVGRPFVPESQTAAMA